METTLDHITVELPFSDNQQASALYGELNRNLTAIEKTVGVSLRARGNVVTVSGPKHAVEVAVDALRQLYELVGHGYPIYQPDVAYALRILERSPQAKIKDIFLDKVYITASQRVVSPKSINQKSYIEAIRNNDIVFGIGPAGTGKTYLAVAMAISALGNRLVKKIVLTRPAVEAGEKLGFLPGDLEQKVNPYLRPLHDALNDMLGLERAIELAERGVIEIAPLAFMRGRTLSNAFVILDEAQNTTPEQMKMLLTRLGFGSKAVITGDITQIDLPGGGQSSGLNETTRILTGINGIFFAYFSDVDVVRHPLVQDIIRAYDKKDRSEAPANGGRLRSSRRSVEK